MENESNKFLVPLAIVVAGALVAGSIYFGGSTPRPDSGQAVNTDNIEIAPVSDEDHILGDINAEIVIIEYSDFECPWCNVFHATMKTILSDYNGRVTWVYRHVPFHSKASKEAEASECAAELGGNSAFWKFADRIFEVTPSNDGLDPAELPKIAGTIGLDVTAFNTCLSSGRYTEMVKKSLNDAVKAGVTGTPYSVIFSKDDKQTPINGAQSLDKVKAKIDALLK